MFDLSPVTLEGRHVRLEPLTRSHRDDLLRWALEPDLWRWTLTRIVTELAFPEASVAVNVTSVSPSGKTLGTEGLTETATSDTS